MSIDSADPFATIRSAGTSAGNYEMDTDDIIARLEQWRSTSWFKVTSADHESVDIEFEKLPPDMDAFVRDLYDFCPDLVDQGTGCVAEMVEMLEETGEDLPPELAETIEGIDFSDEDYGLEILKREIQKSKQIKLWWD